MIKKHATKIFGLFLAFALALSLFAVATKPARAAYGDRITVSGNQFMAGGQRIWINGANTPWNNWDDFGGNFNASWWDTHFQLLRDNGINATRIWILMDGEVGVQIDSTGHVSGATAAHWANLDTLFSLAQSRQIYVQPTLLSFDTTKNSHPNFQSWRNMFNSDANIDSFVTNYVTPFAIRYKANPWIWSIDLINEPDWIVENQEAGQLPWARIQQLAAKSAKAVHANSPILFSVGMAMPKYQSPLNSGDFMSNSALQAFVNDPLVFLDFRITHYYDWMNANWGNSFYKTPADHGFDTSKPWIIGENPALGTSGHTTTQDYESAFTMGWQGAMAWTSNGVDSNGSITQLGPATTAFKNNHTALVLPGGVSPTATFTRTPTVGPTNTKSPTPVNAPDLWVSSVVTAPQGWTGGCANDLNMGVNVTIRNQGQFTLPAGQFVVDVSGTQQTVSGLAAGASVTLWFARTGSLVVTVDITNLVSELSETNNTFNYTSITATPPVLCTRTPTPTRTFTPGTPVITNTPTRTNTNTPIVGSATQTPTPTRTFTPTTPPVVTNTPTQPTGGACTPVTSIITAPFTWDGAGVYCWQIAAIPGYVNNWNNNSVSINGTNYTNVYVASGSLPAKINNNYYISFNGSYAWSHIEVR